MPTTKLKELCQMMNGMSCRSLFEPLCLPPSESLAIDSAFFNFLFYASNNVCYCRTSHELKRAIDKLYVPLLSKATFEGESVSSPAQIPWYVRFGLCISYVLISTLVVAVGILKVWLGNLMSLRGSSENHPNSKSFILFSSLKLMWCGLNLM
jgi:hypothetical protein